MSTRSWIARGGIAAAAILLAGCTGSGAPTASTLGGTSGAPGTPLASATPRASSATADVAYVKGFGQCEVTSYREEHIGANLIIYEHYRCTNHLNDARVNGTMDADLVTTVEPAGAPGMRWEGTLRIVNPGGTWTGTGRGATVLWAGWDHPPTNYGVDVYQGAGGYAGLVYTEHMTGPNDLAELIGWISAEP